MDEKIAIIILNYNTAAETIKLFSSLNDRLHGQYTYFIIDNNSSERNNLSFKLDRSDTLNLNEDTYEMCSSVPDSKCIVFIQLSTNKGYAAGNNYGLKLAFKSGFKYAFIINPDIVIEDVSVLKKIESILMNNPGKTAIAGPKVITPSGIKQGPFRRQDLRLALRNFSYPFSFLLDTIFRKLEDSIYGYNKVYSIVGCFFGLNLKLCATVNFFEEGTFLYFEELILGEKLRQKNMNVVYNPHVKVLHNHIYFDSFHSDVHFKDSKAFYTDKYLRINRISKKIIHLSERYYESVWLRFKRRIKYVPHG
jgi:GT2 family glycosyltransferase